MSVNKVILIGRLGRDLEMRYASSGQAMANFSVVTHESYKDRNGERQKKTQWHNVVAWGKQAETAQQYLKKGSLVFIEGKIQSREWEKDGEKRTTFEVVASSFRMLGGREASAAAAGATGGRASADDPGPEISDEDIPDF